MLSKTTVYLLLVVVAAVGLSACGLETQHQYVQSDDGRLSFRVPHEFTDVGLEPRGLDWVAGLDADPAPSSDHLSVMTGAFPFVLAQTIDLDTQQRSLVSQQQLRTLATLDRRDPLDGHDDLRVIFHEPFVDDLGFEGHVMQVEFDTDAGIASEVQVVALNPRRNSYHRVRIACTVECMAANEDVVADIISSIEMREGSE